MGKFVVIVLDGFGVGEMADVPQVRPADRGANTCVHIFEQTPGLALPNLASLGLANIVGRSFPGLPFSDQATYGRAELMHDGADTFFGHQEIMGTLPSKPFGEPISNKIGIIEKTLTQAGYPVRRYTAPSGKQLLIVSEACTVADNVECDPGQAFNVTAAIDDLPFEEELRIGRLVRSVSVVPRVITFGGRGVHLNNLLDAIEEHGDYIGVNAPASGVYNCDYHCIHMGYGVDPEVQVPTIFGRRGLPVFLLGKVADVVANDYGTSIPMVDTASVLQRTLELVQQQPWNWSSSRKLPLSAPTSRKQTSAGTAKMSAPMPTVCGWQMHGSAKSGTRWERTTSWSSRQTTAMTPPSATPTTPGRWCR